MSLSTGPLVVAPPIRDNYVYMIALTDIGLFARYVTPSTIARSRGQELKVANETMGEHVHLHKNSQPRGGVQAFKREYTFMLLKILLQPAEPMPTIRHGG